MKTEPGVLEREGRRREGMVSDQRPTRYQWVTTWRVVCEQLSSRAIKRAEKHVVGTPLEVQSPVCSAIGQLFEKRRVRLDQREAVKMIWTGAFVLLLLLSIGVVNRVQCHVVLTFPPARYPPLDYLDSASTVGPCGIPKSEYRSFIIR